MAEYSIGETEHRDWGSYTVTNVAFKEDVCTLCEKDITVKPGYMLSVQSHDKRKEHWHVKGGVLTVVLNGEVITLLTGQSIGIPLGAIHTMSNLGAEACIVHEIQEGECSEDDIHRFWDSNGRAVEASDDPMVLISIKSCKALMTQLESFKKNF